MSEAFNVYGTGLHKALEISGGPVQLAKHLKVSRQVVYLWLKRGYVPLARAVEIETKLGVPRASLIDPELVKVVRG